MGTLEKYEKYRQDGKAAMMYGVIPLFAQMIASFFAGFFAPNVMQIWSDLQFAVFAKLVAFVTVLGVYAWRRANDSIRSRGSEIGLIVIGTVFSAVLGFVGFLYYSYSSMKLQS